MSGPKRPPRGRSVEQPTLLEGAAARDSKGELTTPLADRLRPGVLDEIVGQTHLLGQGKPLARAIADDRVPSMILWGPPGSGKTTIARVLSRTTRSEFVPFSAVLSGIPELRALIAAADERRRYQGRSTILFVDEIHRFNKSQQDAFLPHVEAGTITLVGATTENPSFSVNAAVLSRCRVFRLEPIGIPDLCVILRRALSSFEVSEGDDKEPRTLDADDEALEAIADAARGDARRALGLLESTVQLLEPSQTRIDLDSVKRAADERTLLFDKNRDEHYDLASAFIKSMRGSDPNAALYYAMRLLEAGDDPLFVLRRMIIFASEDIGNADPRALGIAVDADAAFRRLGMPEGLYPISQACLYLACAPKSNAVKMAMLATQDAVRRFGALPVPKRLRNGVTQLMKDDGYGDGYRYPHDYEGHFVPEEVYLPERIARERYYRPSDQGVERQIGERLVRLAQASSPRRKDG
ncbi:MAG: replication-associated recombination protein A [Polyangiaceae bacterium]